MISIAIIIASIIFTVSRETSFDGSIGRVVTIIGIVADEPVYKNDGYRIKLEVGSDEVYIMADNIVGISRSDRLTLRGKLQAGFGNYSAFMYCPEIIDVSHPSTPDLALRVRELVSNNVQTRLASDDNSGLALSYLFGQKTLLGEEQLASLRIAGLAHIVVASGYHLSVAVNFAKKRFRKTSRLVLMLTAILLVLIYVSITGFSSSMTRAAIVTVASLLTWYFGRKLHPVRLILYSAAFSLVLNPSYVTNLAWQLSFASYSGILLFSPLLAKFFYGERRPSYISSIIIASISAQLFCLPISILNFGTIPTLALVSNILISPLVSPTMLLGLIVGILDISALAGLLKVITDIQLYIVNTIASIPWSSHELSLNWLGIAIAYAVIILATIILKRVAKYSYKPCYALEKIPDYDKIYAC